MSIQTDICMIVHSDVQHDSRVLREAGSLAAAEWRVALGISLTTEKFPRQEGVNGFTIIRVTPKLFRRWLSGRMHLLLPLIPMFPVLSYRLRQIRARICHAHNFTGLHVESPDCL